MILSEALQEKIRNLVQLEPLAKGEMRRVEGMGELYIALSDDVSESADYTFLYALRIEDALYNFYSRKISP